MLLAKQCLLIVSFLFLSLECISQDPQYIEFGINDGLPSPEVYHALIDSEGRIMTTTDRGVAIYDGYDFKTYSSEDGLLDNTNFRIIKKEDEYWFLGYNGKISIFKDQEFHPHPINKYIDSLEDFTWWEDVIMVNKDEYYLLENVNQFFSGKHILANYKNGKFFNENQFAKYRPIENNLKGGKQLMGFDLSDQMLIGIENCMDSYGQVYASVSSTAIEPAIKLFGDYYAFFIRRDPSFIENNLLVDQNLMPSRIYILKDRKVISILEVGSLINAMFKDKNDFLWVCAESGLTKIWKDGADFKSKSYFSGTNISSIVQDDEGGYWLTTLGAGIRYVPSFEILSSTETIDTEQLDMVTAMKVYEDKLYMGHKNGMVSVLSDISISPVFLGKSINGGIYDFESIGQLITGNWEYVYPDKPTKIVNIGSPRNFRLLEKNDSNYIFHLSSRYVYSSRINDLHKGILKYFICTIMPADITSVEIDGFEKIYLGTLSGMYELDISNWNDIEWEEVNAKYSIQKERIYKPFFNTHFKNQRISDFIFEKDKGFIIGTMGHGVAFVSDTTFTRLTTNSGLSSDLINTLFMENDSTLWIGTINGLDKLGFNISNNALLIKSINHFSSQDGLVSNFITKIRAWQGHIVVGTDKGISYFDKNYVPSRDFLPTVVLDSVLVNSEKVDLNNSLPLSHEENDILINYSATQFNKTRRKNFYNFRLVTDHERDSSWSSTNNRNVSFPNLPPGSYDFQINANGHNNQKGITVSLPFTIDPPFYQSRFFRFLLAVLTMLSIWLVIRQREKNLHRKNEVKRMEQEYLLEINNAQLVALRSQMNPHFIFNALNSIQNFVFKKDVRQANHFLTKFSRLIRKSLELSKLDVVTLEEELAFLNNYLQLEEMRFPNLFDYQFHIPANTDLKRIHIPPLLIQPVLENSIRHGFKGINYKGKLDIYFNIKEQSLSIKILDNGVGLIQSSKNVSINKHKSFAMKILRNRIQMINQMNGTEDSYFKIKEIVNEHGQTQGVEANIFIATNTAL